MALPLSLTIGPNPRRGIRQTAISVTGYSIASGAADELAVEQVFGAAPSGLTATLSATLGAATLSATGANPITGTVSATLDAATLAADGTLSGGALTGTLSATLGAVTLSATGANPIGGTLTATLAAATLAATGANPVAGTVNATLDAATLAAEGTISGGAITATVTATLGDVTLAATGLNAAPENVLRGRHSRPWRDYDKIWLESQQEDPPEPVAVVEPAPEPLPPAPRLSLNELFDVPSVAVKSHAQWVAEDDEDIELLMLA